MSITVSISDELENFVKAQVESGKFSNPDEVVNQGLKKLKEEESKETQLAELRKEIQIGVDAIERGETVEHTEVFAKIKQMHADRLKK